MDADRPATYREVLGAALVGVLLVFWPAGSKFDLAVGADSSNKR